MSSPVHKRIAELQALDTPTLRSLWGEAFSRPHPKRMSRDLLLRALAYDVQEQEVGGLSKAALRRLGQLADPKGDHAQPRRPPAPRPRTGTRLIREWRGEVHQVTVRDEGFEYRGAHYASLSRVAREITGARWSGPLFFGLRKAGPQAAASTDEH